MTLAFEPSFHFLSGAKRLAQQTGGTECPEDSRASRDEIDAHVDATRGFGRSLAAEPDGSAVT